MTCHKGIGIAFRRLGKAGNAAKLAQRAKLLPASGEQLVDIGLVSHIKNETVLCRIINGFQGDRQLHNTQVACQMPSGFGNIFNEKFPDFSAQLDLFFVCQAKEVIVTVDIR